MGDDPPQFSIFRRGRRSCAATCQITREDGGDICKVFFWFDCSFFTAPPRVVTLTALQIAGAFVCAHDYRAVRTVQVAKPL